MNIYIPKETYEKLVAIVPDALALFANTFAVLSAFATFFVCALFVVMVYEHYQARRQPLQNHCLLCGKSLEPNEDHACPPDANVITVSAARDRFPISTHEMDDLASDARSAPEPKIVRFGENQSLQVWVERTFNNLVHVNFRVGGTTHAYAMHEAAALEFAKLLDSVIKHGTVGRIDLT